MSLILSYRVCSHPVCPSALWEGPGHGTAVVVGHVFSVQLGLVLLTSTVRPGTSSSAFRQELVECWEHLPTVRFWVGKFGTSLSKEQCPSRPAAWVPLPTVLLLQQQSVASTGWLGTCLALAGLRPALSTCW